MTHSASDLSEFGGTYSFEAKDFSYVGADGITNPNVSTLPAYACLPDGEQSTADPLGPGQTFVGTIVLDVPVTTGTLIYRPIYTDGGWEWNF